MSEDLWFETPGFATHWRLSDLPDDACRYGKRLWSVCRRAGTTSHAAVGVDPHNPDVVIVSYGVDADELAAAVDRSQAFVFSLIRRAGLYQPGSLLLVAARRNR